MLGLYEVVYKLALPEGHGGVSNISTDNHSNVGYTSLPFHAAAEDYEATGMTPPPSRPTTPPLHPPQKRHHRHPRPRGVDSIPLSPRGVDSIPLSPGMVMDRQTSATPLLRVKTPPAPTDEETPPPPFSADDIQSQLLRRPSLKRTARAPLPTALHANFLTSCIGFATLVLLWIPIPILHYTGIETFHWPAFEIWLDLGIVSWGGAIYVNPLFPFFSVTFANPPSGCS